MNINKIRSFLNIVFFIGVIATVVCYCTVEDHHVYIYVGAASIFLKGMEYMIRFLL